MQAGLQSKSNALILGRELLQLLDGRAAGRDPTATLPCGQRL